MPAVYEHFLTVDDVDIDRLGHANNLTYLAWMLDAALAHSAAQGWPLDAYDSLGAGFVVRQHEIEYLQPALAGDQLMIRTWVANMKRATSLRRYEFRRITDDQVLATAQTNWAFIDFSKSKPRRIPPEVAEAFQVVPDQP